MLNGEHSSSTEVHYEVQKEMPSSLRFDFVLWLCFLLEQEVEVLWNQPDRSLASERNIIRRQSITGGHLRPFIAEEALGVCKDGRACLHTLRHELLCKSLARLAHAMKWFWSKDIWNGSKCKTKRLAKEWNEPVFKIWCKTRWRSLCRCLRGNLPDFFLFFARNVTCCAHSLKQTS